MKLFSVLVAGLLLVGPLACSDGGPDCLPGAETCNGLDDDCDGVVDDGFELNVACSAGVGACASQGATVCAPDGATAVCDAVPGEPAAEQCNGIDDDCDALIDEGLTGCCEPDGVVACGVEPGVCETGTQTCDSARTWGACVDSSGLPVVLPEQNAEVCNGLDDDCDGDADEGFGTGEVCAAGLGSCRASGHTVCSGLTETACDAVPGDPAVEVCDGLDNDCDGEIDEELPGCCAVGTVQGCGANQGVCTAGTQTCDEQRAWGPCVDASGIPVVLPGDAPEECNGRDDDCNGAIDDELDAGEVCSAGIGTCLVTGRLVCEGAHGIACDAVPGEPAPEVCDGLDNDCDGETDEALPGCCAIGTVQACGANEGACAAGTQTCDGQRAWGPCVDASGLPVVLPEQNAEACNGLDDDCDGLIDEPFPTLGQACDGDDLDQCTNGIWTCRADGAGLACVNEAPADIPERCDDGFDNDCDGARDCADADCAVSCAEDTGPHCSDQLDNDQDGLTDCFDPTCQGFSFCVESSEALCHDGTNNDGDGFTDCADPDCASFCSETTMSECHDGRDNDQDGRVDCLDAGCAAVCSEATNEECHDSLDNDQDGRVDCLDAGCAAVCP